MPNAPERGEFDTAHGPGSAPPVVTGGTGSPAGVRAAPVGSVYLRIDGGANTTLYIKESGTGTSGWVAK